MRTRGASRRQQQGGNRDFICSFHILFLYETWSEHQSSNVYRTISVVPEA
jgi:hypothetical protein